VPIFRVFVATAEADTVTARREARAATGRTLCCTACLPLLLLPLALQL
jgi:hypothetical protein